MIKVYCSFNPLNQQLFVFSHYNQQHTIYSHCFLLAQLPYLLSCSFMRYDLQAPSFFPSSRPQTEKTTRSHTAFWAGIPRRSSTSPKRKSRSRTNRPRNVRIPTSIYCVGKMVLQMHGWMNAGELLINSIFLKFCAFVQWWLDGDAELLLVVCFVWLIGKYKTCVNKGSGFWHYEETQLTSSEKADLFALIGFLVWLLVPLMSSPRQFYL